MARIDVRGLTKTFQAIKGETVEALSDLSFAVGENEFVGIVGPSGCGKSTLLYIVGGFVEPTTGTVTVNGKPVTGPGPDRGPVFQEFALSDQQANIVHILEVCRKEFVDKSPELVKHYVRDLTAGMKKALADRAETLKVVNEVIKAPVEVLDTYLLKPNDFAREPGAAPNFAGIQTMFDIYAESGMIKDKLDVGRFRHASIVAPLE